MSDARLDKWLKGVMVADGACATALHARGLPRTTPAEDANITRPELVRELADAYVRAGARILTTNTFAANRIQAARRGLQHDPDEVTRGGAQIARQAADAADHEVLVAGSIGPSSVILAVGERDKKEAAEAFAIQTRILAQTGADLIVLETFSALEEVLLALQATRDSADLPVVASLSFDSGPQRTQTAMGADAAEAAVRLTESGADAVGCNCCAGIANVLPAVVALRANTQRPIWCKPSVGLPDVADGLPVYPQTPEEFVRPVPTLLEAGVNVIGACCGAAPEHIQRLAAVVEHRAKRKRR
jgi:methionine synthase I (cobalamin-dependent)